MEHIIALKKYATEKTDDTHFFVADVSDEEILSWWDNETYNVEDILTTILAPGPFEGRPRVAVNGTGLYPEVEVAVHEVSTAYGRCYTLYFDRIMRTDDEYYELVFNMSRHGKIRLYLHERHNEVKHILFLKFFLFLKHL